MNRVANVKKITRTKRQHKKMGNFEIIGGGLGPSKGTGKVISRCKGPLYSSKES